MIPRPRRSSFHTNLLLLTSIFLIAICGLVYELLAGALSSYLLGDSVYQFSIVIGIFMSSMGLGSFLSRYVNGNLPKTFIVIENAIGVIGGFSAIILFFAFSRIDNYTPFLFLICAIIGTLSGLEIPLILRVMKEHSSLKMAISNVMTFDYLGALAAAIVFPLIMVPRLGLIRTGLLFGFLNVLVAAVGVGVFSEKLKKPGRLSFATLCCAASLVVAFFFSTRITSFLEDTLYSNEIIHSVTTPYQRLVLTRSGDEISMFINGGIQFCSRDEYRYHEALVHPIMSSPGRRKNILILGGGDGLAVREILKYPGVEKVTVIDIDPAVTNLFKDNPLLRQLNKDSLNDDRVKIVNADAWKFIESTDDAFDAVIIDLPDPHCVELSKLYSRTFYRMLASRLAAGGAIVTQATSPMYAPRAFWCVSNTLKDIDNPHHFGAKLNVIPYHAYVPTFGEWGFVLASLEPINWDAIEIKPTTRFLNEPTLAGMPVFPADMAARNTDVNTIDRHKITEYYEKDWGKWYE